MSAPTVTLIDAMTDPGLFEPWFRGETWAGWRAVVKAMDASPMSDEEITFFESIAGGRTPPKHPVRELWAACARRTGKDSVASGIGAYSSAFFDQQDLLRPGERAVILCLACDQSQAKIVLNYIRAYFTDIPMLRSMVTRTTKTGFELNNRVDITVASNDYRSVRGRPVRLAIFDEVAFFRDENSASPDTELYNAIRPALASLPGSRIIGISSPYRKSGLLWNKVKRHFGRDDDDVLVIQAATRTLNPTIDQAFIDQALADDPVGARAEWLGEFRSDIAGYADFELIDGAVDRGITVRPPRQGLTYIGACDPGGGVRDSFVGAVCHDESGVAVLDAVLEIRAPYSPTAACEQVAALLRSYNVRTVTGDRYSAQFVVDAFSKHGVTYEHSSRDRSAIYQDALPLFTSGRVRLLDNPRMVNQFAALERRTSSLGKDRIDHAPGGSDDTCNAAALAMVLASAVQDWSGSRALLEIARQETVAMKANGTWPFPPDNEKPQPITKEWAIGSVEHGLQMKGLIGPPQ
ncbi:hypothetical protein [Nitrobacter sp. TKz-YC02]|uniref:hypothetical protein n=1 Tax=Nitrobacter sp. TKz-YC02 TaxID=3398704 RepID=UPI003CFAC25A